MGKLMISHKYVIHAADKGLLVCHCQNSVETNILPLLSAFHATNKLQTASECKHMCEIHLTYSMTIDKTKTATSILISS